MSASGTTSDRMIVKHCVRQVLR